MSLRGAGRVVFHAKMFGAVCSSCFQNSRREEIMRRRYCVSSQGWNRGLNKTISLPAVFSSPLAVSNFPVL